MKNRHTLVFHLTRLSKKIQEVYSFKSFPRALSYSQAATLLIIDSYSTVSQIEIARKLHLRPASIVTLIDELEKLKLVKRQTAFENRRQHQIVLTEQGKTQAGKINQLTQKLENFLRSNLTQKETKNLFYVLEKLTEGIESLQLKNLFNPKRREVKDELPGAKQFVAS